jgi:arsenate reductase
MAEPIHVLFLCTGNSARSILAEALLNHLGRGRFAAHSAGSMPTRKVNPAAISTLERHGIPIGRPRSKSWDEFASASGESPAMDIIITVCDNAAGEVCPVWPGHPATAHWGIPDPAAMQGGSPITMKAFGEAFDTLRVRIDGLVALPLAQLSGETLKRRLRELGRLQATAQP